MKSSAGHQRRWPDEVFVLGAESRDGLIDRAAEVAAFLENAEIVDLKDLAFTLNSEATRPNEELLTIVAASVSELRARLGDAREKLSDPQCRRIRSRGIYFFEQPVGREGKVAFLFPGEAAQYPLMLADVCMQFPEARAWFDLVDRAFIGHARGFLPSELVFPRGAEDNSAADRLWNMDGAVETVFAANQALLTILNRLDVRPHMMAGHSSGDYSALLAAGRVAISGDEQLVQHIRALNAVYEELAALGEIPKASLLAVGTVRPESLTRLIDAHAPDLTVALDNCPQQVVLCGSEVVIDRAARQLASEGAVTERLPFARPYHTPLFASFTDPLRMFFSRLDMAAPAVEVYSCATATPYPDNAQECRDLAVAQWTRPVRFRGTIEAMYEAGARVFVEVGPRGNLTGFVENTLRGRAAVAVATNTRERSGLTQLNHAIGLLRAHGVPVNADFLYARRAPHRLTLNRSGRPEATGRVGDVKLSLRLPRLRLPSSPFAGAAAPATQSEAFPGSSVEGSLRPDASQTASALHLDTSPPTPPAGNHARVMQAYFNTMQEFLRVEREVMQAAFARRPRGSVERAESTVASSQITLPFIDKVISINPGRDAVAVCELTLDEHRFLRDHTLGASVSSFDADLTGLPVLPLAVSIEMVAEAAALLRPGLLVVGVRNLCAHRWIVLDKECLTLRMTAASGAMPNEVRVQMYEDSAEQGAAPGAAGCLVEATVIFDSRYQAEQRAERFPLSDESASKWRVGEMYGRSGMFHGPAFQLVESIDRSGRDGSEATFVGRAADGWFRRTSSPAFLLDPMVLDAMGQVVGYWVGDRFERGLSVFPVRLDRLEVRSAALASGDKARCRVRVTHVDDDVIRSDIDVVGADGTLMSRMIQWEDRRLDLPRRFYDFRIAPHEVVLSDEWPDALARLTIAGASSACRFTLPRPLLEGHGGIWLRVIAHLVLGREERRQWQQLSAAPLQRRLQWLAGRIAAKDALRVLFKQRFGLLRPADIEIYSDQNGRPRVRGPWLDAGSHAPHVTIAHSGDDALAIAIDGAACDGIGVDIERVGRVGDVIGHAAFTSDESRWLRAIDDTERPEWATRLWCAKEAVGKALGCGMPNGGRDLEVCDFDRGRGVLSLSLRGSLERERSDLAGRPIVACTTSEGSVVTAAAVV